MERAVVVGAFNFIGYSLTTYLLNKGIEVYGFSFHNQENQDEVDLKLDFLGRNINFKYDFDNKNNIDIYLENSQFNTLFFCLNDPTTFNYGQDIEQHLQFSKNLIEKICKGCRNKSSHIVYISSLSIFDEQHQAVDENTLPSPKSNHAIIHYEGEKFLRNAAALYNIPFTILRVPSVYGPWQPTHMAYQQLIVKQLYNRKTDLNIIENTCDILYIDDVVKAVANAGFKRLENEIIHLASGKANEWFVGASVLLADNAIILAQEHPSTTYHNLKAKNVLNFEVSTCINDGINEQIRHTTSLKKFLK